MGYWFCILVAILILLAILGNWIDKASVIGGCMLMYVIIPYFLIWMAISTVKQIKKERKNADEISDKKG